VDELELDLHLSRMSTAWAEVFACQSENPADSQHAISRLMIRYSGAVWRHLLDVLKDPDAADELSREFAVRFLRGEFRHSDPTRGRFRDYVKRAVQKLIKDHYQRKRPAVSLDANTPEPAAAEAGLADFDQQFIESWRRDLLERAWNSLDELQKSTGQPYHTVLRSKVDNPDLPSHELASKLSTALKRPITAGAVRHALGRARRKYIGYVITEVRAGLDQPTQEDLIEELSDLNLLHYCRPFMKHMDGQV
jgi:DNA-directed RNA polymerase specialized sigma24 family protein